MVRKGKLLAAGLKKSFQSVITITLTPVVKLLEGGHLKVMGREL